MKLEVKDFSIGEDNIKEAVISDIGFFDFCDCADNASTQADIHGGAVSKFLQRERLKKQVKFIGSTGKEYPFEETQMFKMPRELGLELLNALSSDDVSGGKETGEILNKGDGVSTPVHYKLGSPIEFAEGKSITELEFIAKTYGAIEDVACASGKLEQAKELFKTCSKPIGKDIKLISIPETSYDQISLADGVKIMEDVLPSFL